MGSGVSISAGIPTGWGVGEDFIRKIAVVEGEECGPYPWKWYETKHGKVDSSDWLEKVAKSPAERKQLLQQYFEQSSEDTEVGKKKPTKAHLSIARLVKDGYIRVIITTNFDRLLEQALISVGVAPTVIASADAIRGASPLAHSACTIIKVHGDYLDARIKNIGVELDSYDEEMNNLLDRIFDEYGLIVCGWSADWDVALREAIERTLNHRYTTYWSAYPKLSEAAKTICDFRRAEVIE